MQRPPITDFSNFGGRFADRDIVLHNLPFSQKCDGSVILKARPALLQEL